MMPAAAVGQFPSGVGQVFSIGGLDPFILTIKIEPGQWFISPSPGNLGYFLDLYRVTSTSTSSTGEVAYSMLPTRTGGFAFGQGPNPVDLGTAFGGSYSFSGTQFLPGTFAFVLYASTAPGIWSVNLTDSDVIPGGNYSNCVVQPLLSNVETVCTDRHSQGQSGFDIRGLSVSTTTVPEPSTFALVAAGLAGALAWSRRRRRGT